ncbi:MAG: hypothetical protein B7Y40_06220 [Gammaproteobacteria bacterium 28-57-27]|nr:MAG: hypothetical protein B7Y40_06220 [Gammaproteobacteria bacterium 28-57-27]
MHNTERDDVAKELAHIEGLEAERLMRDADVLNLRLEQRSPGKPVVCEVIGSTPLELVVVIPGDQDSYTLQALRPLTEGESITLKRRDRAHVVTGTLYHCRKAQRESDHPNLHLAGLKIPPGAL